MSSASGPAPHRPAAAAPGPAEPPLLVGPLLELLAEHARSLTGTALVVVTALDGDACRVVGATEPLERFDAGDIALAGLLSRQAAAADAPVVRHDLSLASPLADDPLLRGVALAALAAIPVRGPGGEAAGALIAIDPVARRWEPAHVAQLEQIAALCDEAVRLRSVVEGSEAWRDARFAAELRSHEASRLRMQRAAQEQAGALRRGDRLARGLLPQHLGKDYRDRVSIAYRPGGGELLGGDFADVIAEEDGGLSFVIGDACGHDPEAAALAIALRGAWAALSPRASDLPSLVGELNAVALREQSGPQLFATLIAGRLPADRREVELVCAGHPPPVLLASPPEVLPVEDGLPLGLFPDSAWTASCFRTRGHDVLLYTDGLVEGRRATGSRERLGLEGLLAAIAEAAGETAIARELPARLIDVAQEANGGPLPDDVAVLHLVSR